MTAGRSAATIWTARSLVAMPLLWVAGALFWLVPILSPFAPGHALYLVPLVIWPFLLLLALGSFCSLMLARGNRFDSLGRGRRIAVGSLQAVLLAIFVIGSIPILTFDLAPDRSMAATAIQTPFAIVAAASIVAEWPLLYRWRAVWST